MTTYIMRDGILVEKKKEENIITFIENDSNDELLNKLDEMAKTIRHIEKNSY